MTLRISITLPSIYPEACASALRNIRDATRGSYEVLVVSPFRPSDASPPGRGRLHEHDLRRNVVWIEEKPSEAKGCAAAHAKAGARAIGEFLTAFSDDHRYVDGWDALAVLNFEHREKLFLDGNPSGPFELGLLHVEPRQVGTLFGIYYGYFPFMRREAAQKIGWYDPAYRAGFSDGDLGLRIWAAGGRCEWSEYGLIVVTPEDARKGVGGVLYTDDDMRLCVERWAPRFGDGWDTSHLRGFNRDVPPIGEGNTLSPKKRTTHGFQRIA